MANSPRVEAVICTKELIRARSALLRILKLKHRMKDRSKSFTVCVEGNIGCGKTTFLQHFSKFEKTVEVLTEPVDRWRNANGHNLLQLMYEDPSRWAMPFQSYVQLTMLDNHILQSAKPVKLMERSIFSARYCFVENMFKSGRILGCEYEVLDEWFKFATSPDNALNLNVDLIIYLKTSPQKALERINVRARSEENQIPLDYLEQLHSLHEDWLIQGKYPVPAPVLVIDADKDLSEMQDVYKKHESDVFGHQSSQENIQSAIKMLASKSLAPASV